jgi:hypothetical protein
MVESTPQNSILLFCSPKVFAYLFLGKFLFLIGINTSVSGVKKSQQLFCRE